MSKKFMSTYGLGKNPFDSKLELNPLICAEDKDWISYVDGWSNVGALDDFLEMRKGRGGPTVFLVSGSSGTGRTSMAHFLVHQWLKKNAQDLDRVLSNLTKVDEGSNEPERELWNWCLELPGQVEGEQHLLCPAGSTISLVSAKTDELAYRCRAGGMPAAVSVEVQVFLRSLTIDLKGHRVGFATIFEGVEDAAFVTAVKGSFRYVDACVVLVVDRTYGNREVISRARSVFAADELRHFELGTIRGREAQILANARWKACSSNRNPFDHAIEDPFKTKDRTIKWIIRLLELMLIVEESSGAGAIRRSSGFSPARVKELLHALETDAGLGPDAE